MKKLVSAFVIASFAVLVAAASASAKPYGAPTVQDLVDPVQNQGG